MKVVIAPDSFKESLSAEDAAAAIASGVRDALPDAHCICIPMADGGEGTVRAIVAASAGRMLRVAATDPRGEGIVAQIGISADGATAVLEMAAASGLELVPAALRNPLTATSYGAGELLRAALDLGVRRIILGIGGSATVDGGAGMLQALGARLLDRRGKQIARGGQGLADLHSIHLDSLDPRLRSRAVRIEVACDVDNPLTGPHGAAAIFGPQKGASPEMVDMLERGLERFAAVLARTIGEDLSQRPGAGAAGGLGAALTACLGARLLPGVALVASAVGLENQMRGADLVITGEGRIDAQTAHGKTPAGVAAMAKRLGKPVVAIAGTVAPGAESLHAYGIDAIFSAMQRPCTHAEAFAEAAQNLRATARNVALLWAAASLRQPSGPTAPPGESGDGPENP